LRDAVGRDIRNCSRVETRTVLRLVKVNIYGMLHYVDDHDGGAGALGLVLL